MLHHNSPDKLNLGLEGSVVYRAAPGTSRVLMNVGPVSEENQQNYRIQQAVNRYNNVPLPLLRPSTLFKCNLLKSKIAKPVNTEQSAAVNVNRTKPETRYAAGHFPTVILGKANVRQAKRNNVLSHLRANEPVLPISRFLDDTSDKYTDLKNTRSVLDVLQDLSRKRIHGKDDGDDVSKRRCKGLGGDQVQEGESFYKPLFVSKAKNNHVSRKDQTTQTQVASSVNGNEETATPDLDPKSELRKKLARKNNEIFASLSSSINSVFFSKRKRVQPHIPEKEIHSAKKQKVEDTPKPEKMEMTPAPAVPEKTMKKIEISTSPPAKDRMMGIYFDLKNAGEVKKNVLETLQKSPGESQFQRSFECPPETDLSSAEKVPDTTEISKTTSATFSTVKPAEISTVKSADVEVPKKQTTFDQSPVSSVSFKFLNDTTEKTKPENATATETPGFSFGSLKPGSTKNPVTIPAPSFKFGPTKEESSPTTAQFKFGSLNKDALSTPEVSKSSPAKSTDEAKTLTGISQSSNLSTGLNFGLNAPTGVSTSLSSDSPTSFNFGAKKADSGVAATSQPSPVPPPQLPKFNFGTSATSTFQATSPSTLAFSKKADTTDSTVAGSFASDLKTSVVDSKTIPAAPFSFGPAKTDSPVTTTPSTGFALTPSFSFGPVKPATTDSSAKFPFEENKSKPTAFGQNTIASPAFAFGQPKPEQAAPFTFAPSKTAEAPATGFSFGPNKSDSAVKPAFAFGQVAPTDSGLKSDGNFGTPKSTEPATGSSPSFSFNQAQPLRSGFSFSQAGTTATATTSGFSFNQNPTESTNIGFSFGPAGSKPFSFGNKASENVSLKEEEAKGSGTTAPAGAIFSFGNTTTDVKPVQFGEQKKESFGSSIFGQQAGSSTSSSATSTSSVFSRLGGTASAEIKTDTRNLFKTPTTDSDPTAVGTAGSLFKTAEPAASSIFGAAAVNSSNAAKSTFSFGQSATLTPPPEANPVTTAASTFGQTSSGFSFGAKTTAASTEPGFSFGKTANKQTTQPFSFGSTPFGASTSTPAFSTGTASFGSGTSTPSASTFGSTTTAAPPAFGSSSNSIPSFGSTTTAPPAYGSSSNTTPSFGSTTTAPPAFGSSSNTTPSFGSTSTAPPAFGASSNATPSFGSTTTAPPAFGASSNATPSFGSTTTAPPAFGSSAISTATPTFGSSNTAPPAFGSSATSTSTPQFGSTGSAPPPFGSSANSSATPSFGSTTTAPPAFGSVVASIATPSFGSTTAAPPAFGSPAGPTSTSSFRATTTAPPAFGGTTPAFGTVAPAFGSSSSTFGATTTTAPPAFGATTTPAFNSNAFGSSSAFGGSSTTPSFGTGAFGGTAPPAFGNPADKPAFGSGTSGFPAASSTPTFGASTATSPQFGNTGFGETSPAYGSANNSAFGSGFPVNPSAGFGTAPTSAVTPAPFNFGSGNATSTPTFKFGANANQNAPFTFGSSNNSGSGFNFSASPGAAFAFGANTSGFNQTSTPGATGFQPGFGQTPTPTPFAPSATFSIGTASTQPPRRHMARSRRRP